MPAEFPPLALRLASGRSRLLILTYHRVVPEPDPLMPGEPTRRDFHEQLEILSRSVRVLPLSKAIESLRDGSLPRAAVCITFDDGYRNNHDEALPVLQNFGMPATFFVATGFIEKGLMWNDKIIESVRAFGRGRLDLTRPGLGVFELGSDDSRRAAIHEVLSAAKYRPPDERDRIADTVCEAAGAQLPERLMLSASEIRTLHESGMEIGAHTVTHPILASLTDADAEAEISASKATLEKTVGRSVDLFAYPNGRPGQDYKSQHVESLRKLGFAAAVTTEAGYATRHSDVLQLPRISIWSTSPWRAQLHLLRSYLGV